MGFAVPAHNLCRLQAGARDSPRDLRSLWLKHPGHEATARLYCDRLAPSGALLRCPAGSPRPRAVLEVFAIEMRLLECFLPVIVSLNAHSERARDAPSALAPKCDKKPSRPRRHLRRDCPCSQRHRYRPSTACGRGLRAGHLRSAQLGAKHSRYEAAQAPWPGCLSHSDPRSLGEFLPPARSLHKLCAGAAKLMRDVPRTKSPPARRSTTWRR
jgi:hypothetical protein